MKESVALKLQWEIREHTAFRARCDPPDHEMYAMLLRKIDEIRQSIGRADAVELEVLAEKLCGVRR